MENPLEVVGFVVGEDQVKEASVMIPRFLVSASEYISREIERLLLLGRKAMINLDSILNSRNITLLTKVCIVKVMVFLVVMYGCESWTLKKVECQRIDAFELWCWKRLLRVPWTTNRCNQSVLKEISPEFHWKD